MADRSGYIGRAPGDSSVTIARQTNTATGVTTTFTFSAGYDVGYLDVYINGVRLVNITDYAATDTSTVTLTTPAQALDVVELVAYKAFNVSNVSSAIDNFSVGGNLSVSGSYSGDGSGLSGIVTGITAGDNISVSGSTGNVTITGLANTANVSADTLVVTGVSTLGVVTATSGTFTGDVSIGGTLTYQDVTNIDSVGMVTARKGIQVLADGLDVTGVGTFKSNVSIADSIIHTGDTDTAIRFPAADTFTVETAGSERVRIRSNGVIVKGNSGTQETVGNGANTQLIGSSSADASLALIRQASGGGEFYFAAGTSGTNISDDNGLGFIKFMGYHTNGYDEYARIEAFVDGTNGDGDAPGRLIFKTSADSSATPTERLRITSTGGFHFNNGELIERVNITAGKLSDNTNIDLEDGMAHLFTTTETTTSTPNIRVNSSTTLNSVMAVGDVISVNIITTAAAAGYSDQLTIDGVAVTEKWNGGSAPSTGGSSGNDFYTYSIIKTGDAAYTVLANVSNFA